MDWDPMVREGIIKGRPSRNTPEIVCGKLMRYKLTYQKNLIGGVILERPHQGGQLGINSDRVCEGV